LVRRCVSRFMNTIGCEDCQPLYTQLHQIWSQLLVLPPIQIQNDLEQLEQIGRQRRRNTNGREYQQQEQQPIPSSLSSWAGGLSTKRHLPRFVHSIVIPAYGEKGIDVAATIRHAQRNAYNASVIQLIVVDAGKCIELDSSMMEVMEENTNKFRQQQHQKQQPSDASVNDEDNMIQPWADIQLIPCYTGGGRGTTMSVGAKHATGHYLTFVHSDTLLPHHWDYKVRRTLGQQPRHVLSDAGYGLVSRSNRHQVIRYDPHQVFVHGCAFTFGHNLTPKGLGNMIYPYGIMAIKCLGNFRAYMFKLPYGDHVLSVPTDAFDYIGGFPNQPFMEDYSLMDFFRVRGPYVNETVRIIPPPAALCSVRRWQQFGVVYVTLVNALVVHRYSYEGWSAEDIFNYYYRPPAGQLK
jgi:glycosyltransferase involved in cell wall biosynthesis